MRATRSILLLLFVLALCVLAKPEAAMAGLEGTTLTVESEGDLSSNNVAQATRVIISVKYDRSSFPTDFRNSKILEEVEIETGSPITSIPEHAFNGCSSLTSIDLPESLESIGASAFYRCSSLTSIDLSEKLTSIGESTFYGCSSLTSIDLPESLESIGASAFYGCSSLTSIDLPEGLTSIGESAFNGCSGLTTMNLPNSLENIGNRAFQDTKITSITLPDSLESIRDRAFQSTPLTSIEIPSSVQSIGEYTFYLCSALTEVTFAERDSNSPSLSIGTGAFEGTNISSIEIPSGVTELPSAIFRNCTNLMSVTLPDGLTTIDDGIVDEGAFYGCTSLKSITLPNSLTTIGANAFAGSGLMSITIPASVTSVDENAFTGCSELTSVEYTQHLDLTKAGIPETVTTWKVQPDDAHHDWSLSGWEWAEDYSSATATFTCSKDYMKDHITQVESTTIGSYTVQPTCTTDGSTTYTATVTFNGQNFTTQQTETITKLEHWWSNWASNNNGTHTRSCQRDGCGETETADCSYDETGHCTVCGAAQSFAVTVSGGNGAGTYKVGELVTITAIVPEGQVFDHWEIEPDVGFTNGNVTTTTATFTMPVNDVTATAVFEDETVEEPEEPTEPETPSTPSTPSQPTTPSEPTEPSGPSTGESEGWDGIRDEIAGAEDGATITIDMNGETEVPAEIFEEVAGKDVTIEFNMGDGVKWEVKGTDIPADANLSDLDLGVSMNTSGIPVDVINAITGEATSVQITLAHDGDFGFTLTLIAPLGEENAGYWANLYHFDEDAEQLNFETAAEIDDDGTARLRLTHASQYAIVIDDHSHAPVTTLPFTDVNADDWFYDPVVWAYNEGLMTGTSATTFEPNTSTTRAMIVAILNRLEGGPTADGGTFTDVADGDWYAEAVNWAASEGIVAGFEDGTFRPNDPITREQMAAILYNYAQWKGVDVSNRADLSRYSDRPSAWANEVMQWAVAEGLISGTSATTLDPQGHATRAQVAAILQRFLES